MPNETALLHAIYKFILEFDPDIITGYNSNKRVPKPSTTNHPR